MKIQWPDQQTYVEKLAEHTQKLYLWCKITINVESSALVLVSLCNNHHVIIMRPSLFTHFLHSSETTELHAHSPGLSFRPAERPERTTQITALRIQARCPQSECEPPQDTRATAASTSKQNCPCGSTLRLEVMGPVSSLHLPAERSLETGCPHASVKPL